MSARLVCPCGWSKDYATLGKAEFNARRHVCPRGSGARRASRQRRCARCGLEVVYENATAAEAKHWFSKHSCQKREAQMLRTALAQQRLDLIDRTPKPCLHKQANHQHGERATYVLDKCRCEPCSKANAAAEVWRERQKAYGRYHKYVNAEHVRAHLVELKEYGIGLKQVSALSGVSNGSLTKIWYGLYADTGLGHERRIGEGQLVRGPARRVLRSTAERIFAVEAVPANLGARRPDHERTPLARQRVRALVALGWSMSSLGNRLGMSNPRNFIRTICDSTPMARETVDRIEILFAELCMTLPPETNQRERISASRSRRYAANRGWLPPLGLDDLAGDDAEGSEFDESALYRRMHGDKSVRLTKAEKEELARRWVASGRPLNEMERLTGVHSTRHLQAAS